MNTQDLINRYRNQTPEGYLIEQVTPLIVEDAVRYDGTRVEASGKVAKMTRFDHGMREGKIIAYLDAILAVRAGSGYFMNERDRLRTELLRAALDIPADAPGEVQGAALKALREQAGVS